MFKNTTRRGLAIGAALSMVFAGLVSTPASANTPFELKPSAGTGYTTFVTEDFTLETVLGSANPTGGAQLKYQVTKAAGFAVAAGSSTVSSVATNSSAVGAASTSVVIDGVGATQTTRNYFKIALPGATTTSASVTVTVTAFIDVNNNGAVDTTEPQSAQTVSFQKYSDVTSAVALTQPLQGDTSLKGTATLTGINTSQVQSAVTFVASIGGAATGSATLASGVYTTAVSALAAAATVSADVRVGGTKIGASSATLTVTKASVVSISAAAVTGDNAKGTAVRLNGAFSVTAKALDANTSTASGVAAVAVTGKVSTSATLSTTKTITVNGTVYTSTATLQAASFALTTDASGNATVAVSSVGLVANDVIEFNFSSQNVNAAALTLTQTAAAYSVEMVGTGFLTAAPGSAVAVSYTTTDQWGVAVPAGHRLKVTAFGTTVYSVITGGSAAASFTATSSANVYDAVAELLEKQNTTTSNWETAAATTTSAVVKVKVTSVAASFTAAPTHSATAAIARVTTGNKAGLTERVTISGQVNHAGQSVTVNSTVAKFSNAAQGVAAVASTYTTTADGNGYFTVSAYVHTAGTATFTYVAGTATASTTLTVGAAAGTAGTVMDITSNATGNAIEPGKTVVAKISLKDEYGNPVAADDLATESFGVVVTGLGFVGSLPTKLNSSGEANVTVLLGSADEGNLVITATYSTDGTAAKQITKVLTIVVGKAAAPEINAVIGSYNGRWAVRVENAKGAVVSVKVGARWFKYTNLNDNYLFSRKSRVGATLPVAVYVNGQLENVATITIK
jgi:trimeric autotransporter adhesin